ncbi:MAG: TIGR02996 domain-containing protein [Kofleriaceae bacterium]
MRNLDLEKRLSDHPDDVHTYEVYADWLQSHAQPRGELIALMLRAEGRPSSKLATEISAFEQRHAGVLRGPAPFGGDLTWRRGFIESVRLDRTHLTDPLARVLDAVLAHPSAALISTLVFRDWSPSEDIQELLDVLARHAPRSLRTIQIDATNEIPGLAQLDALTNLTSLDITSSGSRASYAAPALSWQLGPQALRDIAHHRWPLTRLSLVFGQGDAEFADLRPLFTRDDTSITHLSISSAALARTREEFSTELVNALVASPLASQLEYLDLTMNLSRADYRVLTDHRHRFKKLRSATFPVERHAAKMLSRGSAYNR